MTARRRLLRAALGWRARHERPGLDRARELRRSRDPGATSRSTATRHTRSCTSPDCALTPSMTPPTTPARTPASPGHAGGSTPASPTGPAGPSATHPGYEPPCTQDAGRGRHRGSLRSRSAAAANPDAPSSASSASRPGATRAAPANRRRPQRPRRARRRPRACSATPQAALEAFARLYINWSYRDPRAPSSRRSRRSPSARRAWPSSRPPPASHADGTISQGHIHNSGQVVSLAADDLSSAACGCS